jgi:hypothetical protein
MATSSKVEWTEYQRFLNEKESVSIGKAGEFVKKQT